MKFRFLLFCIIVFGSVNCAPPQQNSGEDANSFIPANAQLETLNLSSSSDFEDNSQIQSRAASLVSVNFSVMCGQNLSQCLLDPSTRFCYNLTNYANQTQLTIMTHDGIAAVTCQITAASLTYQSVNYTPSSPITLTTPTITCPGSQTAYTNGSNTLYSKCTFASSTLKFTNTDNLLPTVTASQQTVTSTASISVTRTMLAKPVIASLNLITSGSTNYNITGSAPAGLYTNYSVMYPYNQTETFNDCRVFKLSSTSPIRFFDGTPMPTTLTAANNFFLDSSGTIVAASSPNIFDCSMINTANAWGVSNASTPVYRTGDYMVVYSRYNTTSLNKWLRSYRYFVIKTNFAP